MTYRLLAAALLCALTAAQARACPFCNAEGQTLTAELNQAKFVLAARPVESDMDKDTSVVDVESVVKDHEIRGKRSRLTIPKYIDPMPLGVKGRFLLFCDVYKGKIDAYRGIYLSPESKVPEYCRELIQLKEKPAGERLKALFAHLDDADLDVSGDAYKEFAYAEYKDFRAIAKDLPAAKVLRWIKSSKTPAVRLGLYASMLGHCGGKEHASALRAVLDDADHRTASGIDGALAGYTMLEKKDGWAFAMAALKDTKEDFYFRYAVLRAVRFLYDFRDDVVPRKQIVDGLVSLLEQKDMADLAIEDLRKWQRWEVADKVMGVAKTEAYGQPIVKRSLLRFALQCRNSDAAKAFVAARKKEDAEAVADAQELLDLEVAGKKPADPSKK